MAYLGLSKTEPNEPILSSVAFAQRCKSLAVRLGEVVGLATGNIAFAPEIYSTAAVMMLGGRASETIARNRGNPHRVIPLCRITDEVFAWAGYRESWQKQGAEQSFRFVEGGLTLHIGRQGELAKPQILRSEWISPRNSAFVNQAGHPHWQLDVLESVRTLSAEPPARFDDRSTPRSAIDFIGEPPPVTSEALVLGLTIERMHLASAALWWRNPSVPVAHPPETVAELDRWILGSVAYLRQEVGRCIIISLRA